MGAGASVDAAIDGFASIHLKQLPEAIEEAIYVHEKFPLIVDTTDQAPRFLRYQNGTFINIDDPTISKNSLNRSLVGAFTNGRTLTINAPSLEDPELAKKLFEAKKFPQEIVDRQKFYQAEHWQSCLNVSLGDADPSDASISPEFVFAICTTTDYVPPELESVMRVIKIQNMNAGGNDDEGDGGMEAVASMYGAKEVIRNSQQLVDAAFDGDMDEVKSWIEKGYHFESCDGRKFTALSEASAEGHVELVKYLLDLGADPNKVSDTKRSAIKRAAAGGHEEIVRILLNHGADPDVRENVSMEAAFDVASTQEIRDLLVSISEYIFPLISCNLITHYKFISLQMTICGSLIGIATRHFA
jgi:hypothetical protein